MRFQEYKYNRTIRNWLILGLLMLIGQVILGGITRLTGSGLSITRWDIITGVIPPLNVADWEDAFNLYKETPQFNKINSSFELSDFKFIYFWEYMHRLWVRTLGVIFIIPFLIFTFKRQLNFDLVKRLALVIALTMLTASAGWIMVQSGLIDRPWVNAYKLTLHFVLALLVVWAMIATIANAYAYGSKRSSNAGKFIRVLLVITGVQLIFAGLMAGMKAGLYYATWPDMNGEIIPAVLLNSNNWTWANLTNYDAYLFAPALVQFVHRGLAYILFVLVVIALIKFRKQIEKSAKRWLVISSYLLIIQVILGIFTVLNVAGKIPLTLGVLHQLFGLLFFTGLLFLHYALKKR